MPNPNATVCIEEKIALLLCHKDPTVLQLAAPMLIVEDWDKERFQKELVKAEEDAKGVDQKINVPARAKALAAVSFLLLDIAPTWGLWHRLANKQKLKALLQNLGSPQMGDDPWQAPANEENEPYPEEIDTEVFRDACGWRTHWPLCDFLREIEVYKNHKFF